MLINGIAAFSGSSEQELMQHVDQACRFLQTNPGANPEDVLFSIDNRCNNDHYRASIVLNNGQELLSKLQKHEFKMQQVNGAVHGHMAFMFPGQGSQYPQMAQELYNTQPVFKKHIDECAVVLDQYLSTPLITLLFGNQAAAINQTQNTQPTIFAVEYALAQLWLSYGAKPDYLLGHSVGEYVAAVIAGVMSLEAGLKLVATRAKLMGALPTNGGMLAVLTDSATVEKHLAEYRSQHPNGILDISTINGKNQVVLGGTKDNIEGMSNYLKTQNIVSSPVAVSHAFHSSLMEPVLPEFLKMASEFEYKNPSIPLISNLTGKIINPGEINAEYWAKHMRSCVRFYDCMQQAIQFGTKVVIEVGANPTLTPVGKNSFAASNVLWLPTIRRGAENWPVLLESVSQFWLAGGQINWQALESPFAAQRHDLSLW